MFLTLGWLQGPSVIVRREMCGYRQNLTSCFIQQDILGTTECA